MVAFPADEAGDSAEQAIESVVDFLVRKDIVARDKAEGPARTISGVTTTWDQLSPVIFTTHLRQTEPIWRSRLRTPASRV